MKAIVEAAEARRRRHPATRRHGEATRDQALVAMARVVADDSPCPWPCISTTAPIEVIRQAIRGGYTAVMIDGSKYRWRRTLPTRDVVERPMRMVWPSKARSASCRRRGRHRGPPGCGHLHHPDEALEFQRRTAWTSWRRDRHRHGFIRSSQVDIETLRRITRPRPADGRPRWHRPSDDVLRKLVCAGAAKMNVSTQVKQTLHRRAVCLHRSHRDEYNPSGCWTSPQGARGHGRAYMHVLGSAGKAAL